MPKELIQVSALLLFTNMIITQIFLRIVCGIKVDLYHYHLVVLIVLAT